MRPEDERYFGRLESELDRAFDVAERAREQGGDPRPEVEIPVAKDMADRVENILGIPGVAERVRELEGEMSREEAALELARDFAEGRVGEFEAPDAKIEAAVRTAVALLTEGVVAAPIEGIDRVELMENDDGTECVRVFYAGPIRSAGGTAQALSVLVADYTRSLLDVAAYAARDDEIERYAEEVGLYDRTTGLQYSPKDEETKFIAEHCPIMLDGESTGDEEVSGFRDLERVGTNNARGGMCLVLAEGIALKAPKIQRYTRELEEVDWPWLQDLIDGTIGASDSEDDADAADSEEDGDAGEDGGESERGDAEDGPPRVEPSGKYLRDLIAGRPVFSHPSRPGGFRLRYGRARNHGFATGGIHPATMHVLDDFLATGTQIKTERPGKAHGIVPVDSIEGPTVRLANGEVRRIDDPEEALEVRNGIEEVLDLGEYLVNYGEFVENNHPLAPASYTVEWWLQEFERAGADVQALADSPRVDLESPSAEEALEWAREYDAPLHPRYTYLWHDLSTSQFEALADAVEDGEIRADELEVSRTATVREALETLLVEHRQTAETLSIPEWRPLVATMGFSEELTRGWDALSGDARAWDGGENAMRAVEEVAPFPVRERAPTRIGNRMGRPEKSERRDLSPAVHTLFPIGEAGGPQRDVSEAARYAPGMRDTPGEIEVSIGRRECEDCGSHTFRGDCPDCGGNAFPHYECPDCGTELEPDEAGRVECARCEVEGTSVERRTIDLREVYRGALERVGEREGSFETLKGVKGLTSSHKTPEPMEKGVLRAKHDVSAFKDGTVRYDMTDLPVTSVRPAELDVSVEQFRELGYHEDVHGDPLEHDDQLVELRVQDVVLSDGAADHLRKTADFVDDLLENYYGLEPFYGIEERDDLVGELVFGMAPHTSAAVVGRVVGFTSAAVGYAHPYFHAAKRRNCFHPETKVWFREADGEWRYDRIETLVETNLDDPRTDDFGTFVRELDGDLLVPSVDEDGSMTTRSIEAVSRHPASDHLLEIETRSGRRIRVTPDHSMRRWRDGVERVAASEIEPGDAIPSPKRLPIGGREDEIDLLAELLACDAVADDLVIRGLGSDRIRELFNEATSGNTYLDRVSDRLGVGNSTVYNWIGRDSVPAAVLVALFDERTVVECLPEDIELGVRRDRVSVARTLSLDEEFSALLGYYAAEGFTRRDDGNSYQTTICTPDEAIRTRIVETFADALGVAAYEESEWKVTVSSRLVTALFDDVLDAGSAAVEKRIPDPVFDAPDDVLAAFLAAYFSGDGSVSKTRLDVRAHTVSDELKEDLLAALKRFGIASKTYAETRRIETGPVAEFYGEDSPEFDSWALKITSRNALRFADRIGFDLDRKSIALSNAVDSIDARPQRLFGDGGELWLDEVFDVSVVESDVDYTYSVTVEETHTLVANDLFVGQCDGDEDCVMLLMDGLLNFSKEYLPDKRGGSVAEDSRLIAFDPDGNLRFMTFDEFWDELEVPTETDGKFRKKTVAAEGWRTYAFDENHEASLKPIEKAIRYRADDDETLLRIGTQFGREIEITTDHSLFRYDNDIEEIAGADLEEGDLVIAPRDLPVESIRTTIDVLECVDDPYVLLDAEHERWLTEVWNDAEHGDDTRIAFDGGLSYRLSKEKVCRSTLEEIESEHGGRQLPDRSKIGWKGSSDCIDRYIDVDEDFAWLLGMFVADGTLSGTRPAIHNADDDLVDRVVEAAQATLGCDPTVRWSNRVYEVALPAVFFDVLYDLGFEDRESYGSCEKIVPDRILRADRDVLLAFLRGFIAGDGSESTDDNHTTIAFHTTSEDVKDGLVFCCHRLGLVANVSRRERDSSRQPIYAVTISGGASDNPFERILEGEDPYHPKSLVVAIPDALMTIREMEIEGVKRLVPKYLKRRDNISLAKLEEIVERLEGRDLPERAERKLEEIHPLVEGDLSYLRVTSIERVAYDGYLYDLQVGGDPIFMTNWLYAHNSMDAPLVMSSRIDPAEIDDEAHNMDVVEQYPLEFYEATREMADPGSVDIAIAEDTVGTDGQYAGFAHTHDTSNIALGPELSAYKTLGSMTEKMDAQLELARKLRAVDETDVAERVIEYHFLPDLIGNLRAFSSQETRCLSCGTKYRRMPLSGSCRECGGDVNLTVHQGSVNKYMDTAIRVAEEYGCREYTKQRLKILERSLESVFENDKNKSSTLSEFM